MSELFPTWKEPHLSSTASLFSPLSARPEATASHSQLRQVWKQEFLFVNFYSGNRIPNLSCRCQHLFLACVTWRLSLASALLDSASLAWFSKAFLDSFQLCVAASSGTRVEEGMLVSWWRSRGRGTGRSTQPHLKLLLSHGIPDVWAHSTGQSKSVIKSIVKCMGKHTLPTASMIKIEKEKLIINNYDLP